MIIIDRTVNSQYFMEHVDLLSFCSYLCGPSNQNVTTQIAISVLPISSRYLLNLL